MRFKKFLFLPLLCLFSLTSCNNNNDPYKDKIVKDNTTNIVTDGNFKTNYSESDKKFSIGDLVVYCSEDYGENPAPYYQNDDEPQGGYYFVTTSNETPISSRIKPNAELGTGKNKEEINAYVAYIKKDKSKMYIAPATKITLTNSKALNPILYYVGGAFIIIAAATIIYFAKRYKETH